MPEFPPRNPDFRAAVERYVSAQRYLALIGVMLGASKQASPSTGCRTETTSASRTASSTAA